MAVNAAIENHLGERSDVRGRGKETRVPCDSTHGPGVFVVDLAPDEPLAESRVYFRRRDIFAQLARRIEHGAVHSERVENFAFCKSSSDSPVRRSMISPRRMKPRSEYSTFVPGSRTSGSASTRAKIASCPFASL